MRNLLHTFLCNKFQPSFDNRECDHYLFAEDSQMNLKHGECGYCNLPNAYRCVADVCRIIPLSHSSVSDFCTCHYLYYLKKILGIEVRPAFLGIPLKAGVLWDSIKQKHLGNEKINIKEIIAKYEIDEYTVAKVKAIYHAYKELEITVDPDYELQAKVNLTYDIIIPPSSFIPSITVGKEVINLWSESNNQSEDDRTWKFPLSITGFYDRKYSNYFTEDKLSGRPEFYLDPFLIASQVGTYFLADPNLEYCLMEIVQFPQQKILKESAKRQEETPDQMYNRARQEILSQPSKYFITPLKGFQKDRHRYGLKLHRGEFDLNAIKERYIQVVIELLAARWNNGFYKNFKSCSNILPGIKCDMQTICKTGNVSETIYSIRGKG